MLICLFGGFLFKVAIFPPLPCFVTLSFLCSCLYHLLISLRLSFLLTELNSPSEKPEDTFLEFEKPFQNIRRASYSL